MRTLLVCFLVAALLGFVFAEPIREKRFWLDDLKKVTKTLGDGLSKAADVVAGGVDSVTTGAGKLGSKLGKGLVKASDVVADGVDKIVSGF
ncbi:hypothetical protein ElyMa_005069700 [Elysia marginata]|uniref:Uncharacterized protein n=1 Tax=Elysia marginata TaxID=1093978 RepID=A0AAV4JDT4_9GAST|nr:hypothetical protein ElyMa_005069700 [Elysia marginata]